MTDPKLSLAPKQKGAGYSCLLFDADDTIFDFQSAEKEALEQVLKAYKLPRTDEVKAYYRAANHELWRALEEGKIKRAEVLEQRFAKVLAYIEQQVEQHAAWGISKDELQSLEPAELNRQYLAFLAEADQLLPGAGELLPRLKQAGYQLFLLTNGVAHVQRRRLEKSGLASYFESVYISEEVGYEKPDPAFFAPVMQQTAELDPACRLMIGDSLTSDMQGAEKIGIDRLWFNVRKKARPQTLVLQGEVHDWEGLWAYLERKGAYALPCLEQS